MRGSEFGLVFVVINVIVVYHIALGRESGLTGANDQAYQHIFEVFTDELHQTQTSVVGFHHHIDQGYRDVCMQRQHGTGFSTRASFDDFKPAIRKTKPLEVDAGERAHVGFVVNNQQLPRVTVTGFCKLRGGCLIARADQFHGVPSSIFAFSRAENWMSNWHPVSGWLWQTMVPPSWVVTML